MNTPQPLFHLLGRLWTHISPRRRGQFGLLLVLMVISTFAEVVSIGAVLPFLGVLTAPEQVFAHPYAAPVIRVLNLTTPSQLLLPLTVLFGGAAITAGAFRLLLLWASTRLSYAAGADLSINVYRRTLYQPYAVHCSRNSSEVINGITSKTSVSIQIINMLLIIISSVIMLISIFTALLAIDLVIALSSICSFGLIYGVIIASTRKRLTSNSQSIAKESTRVLKSLQEGLGGIRDVLIDGSQGTYCQIYRTADIPLRRVQGNNVFISGSPRFAIEALGMVLMAILAFTIAQEAEGVSRVIPTLGALALGAQRLLPVLQATYSGYSTIRGNQASLQDTLELLDQPLPANLSLPMPSLPFKTEIGLKQLTFRYAPEAPVVLDQIDLVIPKGQRIGFIGTTGSGKSTLLDIVMGLLLPTQGELTIDGTVITEENRRSWRSHIAHVPQAIFLSDSSIAENIAFGIPVEQIDMERVKQAARKAQIAETIESWDKGYQTFVGERGVRLSGGQRQRIGIARALYKKADVIVFDEATSALDNETETAVMEAIDALNADLTVLIVAHRLTTLRKCDQVVELNQGVVARKGTYEEIVNRENRT